MNKIITASIIGVMASGFFVSTSFAEWVNGYYRKNGTYVQGYHRTKANNSVYDNYSTKGNTNPYTGAKGTVDPDSNSYGYGHSKQKSNGFGRIY